MFWPLEPDYILKVTGLVTQSAPFTMSMTWLATCDNRRMDSRAAGRRTRMTTRLFPSLRESDRHDLAFWRQIPAAERVLLAWTLSVEQWTLSEHLRDESGLCRSVASVRRG